MSSSGNHPLAFYFKGITKGSCAELPLSPEPPILAAIWADAKRKGTNKLTMRQIDAEIHKARRARKHRGQDDLKQQVTKGAIARSQRDKAVAD